MLQTISMTGNDMEYVVSRCGKKSEILLRNAHHNIIERNTKSIASSPITSITKSFLGRK